MPQARTQGNGDWLTRERTLILVLAAGTVIFLYLCYSMAAPFAAPLTWALALAVIAYPLHEWLTKRLRGQQSISAALTVLLVATLLIGPAVFVANEIGRQVTTVLDQVENGEAQEQWAKAIKQNPRVATVLESVGVGRNLNEELKQAAELMSKKMGGVVAGTVAAATGILITLFLLFYFFRDGKKLTGSVRGLVPLGDREAGEVFHRVRDTIYAVVYGTLVVALIQGALGGLMFWVLGLPGPLLWGAIMAILAVLPVFGAAIVWVPGAVFLALEGDVTEALILTGWGSIVVAMIDNLLYPILVKDRLRLHTVPVFVSIVGGLVVFGAAGVVLGPVVLAITVALIEIWRRRTAHGRAAEHVAESGTDRGESSYREHRIHRGG
jgi:predicted PurR-regulated permease PerM